MYVTKSINANHEDLIHDVAYDFYGKRMATCSSDQKVKVWDQQENGEWVCSARCTPIPFSNQIDTIPKFLMKSTARGSNNFSVLIGACQNVFLAAGSLIMALYGKWIGPIQSLDRYREKREGEAVRSNFQVIATCSFDRTAAVWEEIVGEKSSGGLNHWVAILRAPKSFYNIWCQVKKTSLVDSRTSVTDVKFGPKHLGLILATCSADGTVGDEKSLLMKNAFLLIPGLSLTLFLQVRIYEAQDVMNLSQWSPR